MTILLLQSLFNVLFIVVAYGFLSYKRRVEQLELEFLQLKEQLRQKSVMSLPDLVAAVPAEAPKDSEIFAPEPMKSLKDSGLSPTFVAALPAPASVSSTLVEKPVKSPGVQRRKTLRDTDPAAAFEKAEELLRRGLKSQEVARLTGLSLSELSLMGKVGRRVQ
jgi:hypothetical protein